MTIKVYQQKCFPIVTKNLNWELFTLKDGMGGIKDKKFYCDRSLLKNQIFSGVHEKPIYSGIAFKGGTWTVCRFKWRLEEIEGVVFLKTG